MDNPHIVRKTTNPVSAPPEAGIHWVNTVLGKEFFSIGTATVADWIDRAVATSGTWGSITGTLSSQTDLQTALDAKVPTSYLDTDVALTANSDVKVATQKATKAYADTKQAALGFTAENVVNKDTDGTLAANSATLYPSQSAVKTYADAKVADSIADSVTTIAPSQNAVFDALALKASLIDIQTFTSSGTWNKPSGVPKLVRVIALGAGGGGGSGRRDNSLSVRCGGGGGGTGTYAVMDFAASQLASAETVTIGAGGTGGAGKSATGNGNPGSAGGNTTFGNWLKALGGSGGSGGTAADGLGGTSLMIISGPFHTAQRGGANASATGGNGVVGATPDGTPSPGASGGGVTNGDAGGNGAAGGGISSNLADNLLLAGGLAGGAAPANAGNGNNYAWIFGLNIGTGGGSSAGSSSSNTGNGGNGGYGAGGGGAGAVQTGFTGGNGGTGGQGMMVVITYY